jgi:hypothetical protein
LSPLIFIVMTSRYEAADHTAACQGTFMASNTDDTLTFVLIARIPPEGVEAFRAYEDQVLPLMNEHGGQLQRRLRNEAGTVELHIVSFPSDIAHQKYRSDPRRTAAALLLERSSAKLELLPLRDVH